MSRDSDLMNQVVDSLDKYRCSKHGLDFRSECLECRRQFKKWADEHGIKVIWCELEEE